ncbi:MAG: ABC transporter substrate-binding protein [Neisseriaceae bacterium]|nr:ABC transporter substrate-binding protein [Neisseriaceae bacterium]
MHTTLKKLTLACSVALLLSACGGSDNGGQASADQVIIYTNADDEAKTAMADALNGAGMEGKYLMQTFGTSELGGRLLAEGKNIEADMVTMSSYFLDSAQAKNQMFVPLTFERQTLSPYPDFYAPIISIEGTIIVNTKELADKKLPKPTSLKDLGKPEYKDLVSIPDPNGSSTAWLLTQAIVSAYGDGPAGKAVMNSIINNAGHHVEQSGSAPLKKTRAGEVALGFGLRHQVVADKVNGLPIDLVDPTEGNFALTEAVAVVDKGEKTNPLASQMAEIIIKDGRKGLTKHYPNALYEGETTDENQKSAHPKQFGQPLTTELLEQHKAFFHNQNQ